MLSAFTFGLVASSALVIGAVAAQAAARLENAEMLTSEGLKRPEAC